MKKIKFGGGELFTATDIRIIGAFGSCPPCVEDELAPNYLCNPCDSIITPGGIKGWVAKRCNYEFTDITDEAEWEAAVAAKLVFGRVNGNRILGELPAPDFSTKVYGSCGLEEVTRESRTVTLQDNENDSVRSINDLYNFMRSQPPGKWDIAFVTCDDVLIGFYGNVNYRAYSISPQTKEENSYWTIEFRYDEPIAFPATPLSFLSNLVLNFCCVDSILLSITDNRVGEGDTLALTAVIAPTNATAPNLLWTIQNGTGSATINASTGVVTGVSAGSVFVTATSQDVCGAVSNVLELQVTA
jgi:hypothetical protein